MFPGTDLKANLGVIVERHDDERGDEGDKGVANKTQCQSDVPCLGRRQLHHVHQDYLQSNM